jgi:Calcineurin-like phosphoesterase
MRASSRDTAEGAGWRGPEAPPERWGSWTELLAKRKRPPYKPFRWISVDALLKSYNDVLTRFAGEKIIYRQRQRWLETVRASGLAGRFDDLVVDRTDLREPRLLVVGDPGEGDPSQYCVATALRAAPRTDLMVLCSDVIYPAGDVNDYTDKFYLPYADYPGQVYALPGNHDWYDLLHGFMYTFCDATAPVELAPAHGFREVVARALWRKPRLPDPHVLEPERHLYPPWRPEGSGPVQPAPYYAIDTGPVRFVCIDTGINGTLDAEQGEWLRRVSAGQKPKVLLTGKPLVVDYKRDPCKIEDADHTVDDVVRAPEHNYVAAIGGDIHNYQRYPVDVNGRVIQYVVAGGGGAYMHATHRLKPHGVPKDLPDGVSFPPEERIRLYPLRGDSLAFYARQAVPYLRRTLVTVFIMAVLLAVVALSLIQVSWVAAAVVGLVPLSMIGYLVYAGAPRVLTLRGPLHDGQIDPDVASAYLAERYNITATRPEARRTGVSRDARRVLELVMPLRQRGFLVRFLSEILDSDEPPFFKQFLVLSVRDGKLVIECRAVPGWAETEADPPVEDRVEIDLTPHRQPGMSPLSG